MVDHRPELNEIITKFAPNYTIDSITVIDRNVLRLGVFELKFHERIPCQGRHQRGDRTRQRFWRTSSGRFVNGVLGAIYKDMVAHGEIKEVDKQKKEEPTDIPNSYPSIP